ncbi:MAG TPA: hypothetical protein EYP03_02710 [Aquificae bacterium]|nr:hypothetical protein [Aquificota bacterium]
MDFSTIENVNLNPQEYSIILKNIKLVLHCGDIKEERVLGIETLIDLEVKVNRFIDYIFLYRIVENVAKKDFKYLEDFALTLSREMFKSFDQIKEIEIYLRKKSLPFNFCGQEIGVKLKFKKDQQNE